MIARLLGEDLDVVRTMLIVAAERGRTRLVLPCRLNCRHMKCEAWRGGGMVRVMSAPQEMGMFPRRAAASGCG